MPSYSYHCKCGIKDITHKIGDSVGKCEKCGQEMKRIFLQPPSAIIKNPLVTRVGRGKG